MSPAEMEAEIEAERVGRLLTVAPGRSEKEMVGAPDPVAAAPGRESPEK